MAFMFDFSDFELNSDFLLIKCYEITISLNKHFLKLLKHPVVVDGQQKSESDQLMDYG